MLLTKIIEMMKKKDYYRKTIEYLDIKLVLTMKDWKFGDDE